MWMEWCVPLQKLEVAKIKPGALQTIHKPLTPLSYSDGPFSLQHLNVLLPPLSIKEYDTQTGKLVLTLSDSTLAKVSALQETLLGMVFQNQKLWFPDSNRSYEQIQMLFQPFVESNGLHLYCPLQTQEKKFFFYAWKDGAWTKLTSPGILQKGDFIRVALRIQGISYQMNQTSGSWTGRFRIQHRILCMYHCGSKPSL
jgi:hypothetical protein